MSSVDLARLIPCAYEAVGDIERWPGVLDSFRRAFDADAVVQFSADADPSAIRRTRVVNRRTILGVDEDIVDLHARFAPTSLAAPLIAKAAVGTIHQVYDLVDKPVFDRSLFYDRCVRPTPLSDALLGSLSPLGPDMAIVNFFKTGGRFTLSDGDRAIADVAMAHLSRAFQLNLRLESIGMAPHGMLARTLDTVSVALICIGAGGECLWINDRAQILLAAGDGASLDRHGRLGGATNRETTALRKLVDHLRVGVAAACSLERPSGRLPLSAVSTPYPPGPAEDVRTILGVQGRPVGVIALHEPEAIEEPAALHELEGRLKALFALTSGEARVAVMLYQTPGLQTVADRLGLSRATVHTHLRRIFTKMDITTQSELARRIQALTFT